MLCSCQSSRMLNYKNRNAEAVIANWSASDVAKVDYTSQANYEQREAQIKFDVRWREWSKLLTINRDKISS